MYYSSSSSVYRKRVIVLFWTDKCVLDNEFGTCIRYVLGCENKKLVLEMCPSQIKALNFWLGRSNSKGSVLPNNKGADLMTLADTFQALSCDD